MKLFIRITFIVLILTSFFSGVTFCATGFSGDALDVSYCPGNQFPPLAIIDEITNDSSDDYAEFKREKTDLLCFWINSKKALEFLLSANYSTISLNCIPIVNLALKNIPLARDTLIS